jgi:hypothetical protein
MMRTIWRAVLVGLLLIGQPVSVLGQDRMVLHSHTSVWSSPVRVKEHRAAQRSGQLDALLPPRGSSVDAILASLPLCALEKDTRVAVIETVEEQIVRVLALDGRMQGCRGWIGSEALGP